MIHFGNAQHGWELSKSMKAVYSPDAEMCISRTENEQLYGGCIYDGFTGPAIGIHICGMRPNWINRQLIWYCFAYPFIQLKCNMLLGKVASTNEAALKLDLHLGFKVVCSIPGAVPGGDLLIVRMDREDCHWLRHPPRAKQVINGQTVCAGSA